MNELSAGSEPDRPEAAAPGHQPAAKAERIYGVTRWGAPYFKVLDTGELGLINPQRPQDPPVSLYSIVEDLREGGIPAPLVLRVTDYLEHRLLRLNRAFADAIAHTGYQNHYRGVFPIKVNQQAQVVDRIVQFGAPFGFGLEAGSKPELVIALAHDLARDALIVCNGVKDAEFVKLAMLSTKLDFNTIIVLESPREADTVIRACQELDVRPKLGVRVKLTNRIGGAWAASSGDRSTFGMNTDQLIRVVDKLRKAGLLDCLVLQHSHLGSQVPDVNDVRRAVGEACRYFTSLTGEGAPLQYLDLGGGLGVDYTGEKRAVDNSINYTVEEYCINVVEAVHYAMDEAGLAHPVIVTESGRATVASSSMLIFDVLESTLFDAPEAPRVKEGDHHYMSDLAAVPGYLSERRVQECWNDAFFYRNELRALYLRGHIDLRQMARAERVYLNVMAGIRAVAAAGGVTEELAEELNAQADIYHCNFSLFQSLPDVWAIDQLHPIMPLQMLDRTPDRRAILSDITCDSDGVIKRFILGDGVGPSLPVHSLPDDRPYYLGVFMVGAYQETLGDLHNLFGDTNVATIRLTEQGGFELLHEQEGDTINEILDYVEYDPDDCIAAFRKRVDRAILAGRLRASDRRALMQAYRESISGYSYYE